MPTRSCPGSRAPRSARSSSSARSSPHRRPRPTPDQPVSSPVVAVAAPGRILRTFPALQSPLYRRYLLAGMFGTVAAFMLQTAQGWLVLVLTNSPALLGLA